MKIVASIAIAVLLALAALPAKGETKAAAKPAKEEARPADGNQRNRMKTCNAEAAKKQLKGDERRAFMSACLKG